jgi:hypothetical protein
MGERITQVKEHAYIAPPLTNALLAEKGKRAFLDSATGKVVIAPSGTTVDIGEFAETRTGDGTQGVMIRLHYDLVSRRWANDTVVAVAATDIGRVCFIKDASTVSKSPAGGRQRAGMVLEVSTLGVVVASMMDMPMPAPTQAVPAFVAGDLVVPDYPRPGAFIDVPTTAANSTVTLPANAIEGCEITFIADGTKNGHTVTYRDATGPVSLTAALTLSKRHLVRACFLGGKWACSSTVAP